MTKYITYLFAFLLLVSLWFCEHYKNKYEDLVSQFHVTELQSEIKKLNIEKVNTQKVIAAKDTIKTEEDKINEDYNRIYSAITNNSMYDSKNSGQVPNNTKVTERISEASNRQLKKCRATYYELEKEYLILAKDRDIVISHYNALLDFYNVL